MSGCHTNSCMVFSVCHDHRQQQLIILSTMPDNTVHMDSAPTHWLHVRSHSCSIWLQDFPYAYTRSTPARLLSTYIYRGRDLGATGCLKAFQRSFGKIGTLLITYKVGWYDMVAPVPTEHPTAWHVPCY